MRQRTLVTVTAAVATLAVVLTASAAPRSHAERPGATRVTIDGLAGGWDAAAASLTIVDPDVHGGSRAARRVLRSLDEIELGIGPRTRVIVEDEDGVRERIEAEDLFAELDDSAEDLEVEATALVERRAGRRPGAAPTITAKRIVLYPAATEEPDAGAGSDLPDGAPGPDDDPRPGLGSRG